MEINPQIAGRHYQVRTIQAIDEAFEQDSPRGALVAMATGAGKTRTVFARMDQLMRANWTKPVLFFADRVALVNEATNAFKQHLPGSAPVNPMTEQDTGWGVYFSTYLTMMGLINQTDEGGRRVGRGRRRRRPERECAARRDRPAPDQDRARDEHRQRRRATSPPLGRGPHRRRRLGNT